MTNNLVITIGREFGSGGREVARKVAEKLNTMPDVEEIYFKYALELTTYPNDLYIFLVDRNNAGSARVDKVLGTKYTFTYPDGQEIMVYYAGWLKTLNQAYDSGYVTTDILEQLNADFHDCGIAHSYDEGEIIQIPGGGEEILYTCYICGAHDTAYIPADFSFAFTWGFDGFYDSKTGRLRNGNDRSGNINETTLFLEHDELMNIYRILYNSGFFGIKDSFCVRNDFGIMSPSYNVNIKYELDGEEVEYKIYGTTSLSYSKWDVHCAVGFAYSKVLSDYIFSSDEYKALPPNYNAYD